MVTTGIKDNCYLINAPAGSGKTTRIEKMILNILGDSKELNILCITYTNRAAEELINRIDSDNVYISTIHSFINQFINSYFTHKDIINLYFEVFGEEIKFRIENKDEKDSIVKANNRYIEEYGELSYKFVKQNIKKLSYNEMQHSSLYRGALSHDDLLFFTFKALNEFPKIKKKISQKYDYIFIDEYQDTSADVLKLFYNTVVGERTKLYLFGDKMQQIYKNYDGTFEEELARFDTSTKLQTNFRSSKMIVNTLNKIYNDPQFKQKPYEENVDGIKPIVYFEESVTDFLDNYKLKNPDVLQLVIYNRMRFESIGAGSLFKSFSRMDRYSYGAKHSAVEVLTMELDENPDDVFKELLFWQINYDLFRNKKYGLVIQNLKAKLLEKDIFNVDWHSDKVALALRLEDLFAKYEESDNDTIINWLRKLNNGNLLTASFVETYFDNDEYKYVLDVLLKEFKHLYSHLKSPKISTQHGVKGEGHDEMIFVAEDAKRGLSVYMYDFLKLWATNEIVFTKIQEFYFKFKKEIDLIQKMLPVKFKDFDAELYKKHENIIHKKIIDVWNKFKDNIYFEKLYTDNFVEYFNRKNVTWMKECMKLSKLEGILTAYKLFYVGCSRAKKKLSVLINKEKVKEFEEELKQKFKNIGFEVM